MHGRKRLSEENPEVNYNPDHKVWNKNQSPNEEEAVIGEDITHSSQGMYSSQIEKGSGALIEQERSLLSDLEPDRMETTRRYPERVKNKSIKFTINGLIRTLNADQPATRE